MLTDRITACRLCAARFAATRTAHAPRPVARFQPGTPILVAGQAPGMRVHDSGLPFDDRSGDRLRDWMGLDRARFYDPALVSFVPTAFCFPGYDARGADLPPPPICWETWHADVLDHIGPPQVRLLIGAHAIARHLGRTGPLGPIIADWRAHAPATFVLPHPSWRNTGWLRRHPAFETETIPALRHAIAACLSGPA